jgi:probable HAF family extracellular repeat protein
MSSARAINNAGQVVGMATDSAFMLQRVVWDLSSGAIVRALPNYDLSSTAEPESINDLGQVSGTERISSSLATGVFWNEAGSVFGLPPIAGGSPSQMAAHQINRDGYVVGSSREGAPGYRVLPVMWHGTSAPVSLGFLGNGAGGAAFGINDARHVVGEASNGTTSRGFLWRGDKLVDLGAVGGSAASSRATAVNNVGVIAGTSDSG